MRFCLLLFFTIALVGFLQAQPNPYPIFGKSKPIIISGSFAEPRGQHKHTGLDFYTYNQEGWPVHVPWAGTLKEIGFEENGLGLYLKISHESLKVISIYGHLQKIHKELLNFYHFRQQSWFKILKQNPFLKKFRYNPPKKITIQKGQIIAFSGQSGIGTPHLHVAITNHQGYQDPLNYFRAYLEADLQLKTTRMLFYGEKVGELLIVPVGQKKYQLPFKPRHVGISLKDMYSAERPLVPSSHLQAASLKTSAAACQKQNYFYDNNFRFSIKYGYTILFDIDQCLKGPSNLISLRLHSHTLKKKLLHFRIDYDKDSQRQENTEHLLVMPKQRQSLFLSVPKLKNKQLVYLQDEDGHLWPDFSWQYNHKRGGYEKQNATSGGNFILRKETLKPLKLSAIEQKTNQWGSSYWHIQLPRAISGYKQGFVYLKGPLKTWQKLLDAEAGILFLTGQSGSPQLIKQNLQVYTQAGNLIGYGE